ncbi:DNA recombination protein RecN [Actibacterium mucosum KCTC 23349]|uniref:DNA repair protein RecN n=1 Tax=Actibacterium mucosum KCTC 23349 TaxID=1454373 RepID=A0A037ZLM2_9RHOB|nr:DNA repair protein RecN [Actibacterium mucosum]KAJ55741.1 DNA recombination protein RecN [Actibacterium mucosum KCTC 23349]
MLRSLEIRDILIIDRLELGFQPGLNVLTGETGAGKSILLDALGFVLGWRGRAELVRRGAAQGEVVAEFDLPHGHPAFAVLDEAGLDAEDGTLIMRRINTVEGRKTAWVNDRRVSGQVLRELSDTLVELHGQHDDKGLLNPRGHRTMLDGFAGLDTALAETRAAWRQVAAARKALDTAEAALAEIRTEEEFLRHAVAELDGLDPQPGEEADLDSKRRLMQAADKVREDIAKAIQALGGDGAEGRMGDAQRWLEDASDATEGALGPALDALSRAQVELGEAQSGVAAVMDQLSFNPAELEMVEERLFAIRGLARKHNVLPDELGNFAADLRAKLGALDAGAGHLDVLKAALNEAQITYDTAADALGLARAEAAERLDTQMAGELAPLKMERAVFATEITEGAAGPEGRDEVAFTVATNPGAPAGALNKIASGGELSRFLLALKVCLTREARGLTMIFDEIDRGVGGATADAVGRRLAALADEGQVLVVTHSPQVAAQGAHHWRVAKRVENDQTLSEVLPLAADERTDEIARMLSGDTITTEARAAARALLNG